MLIEAFTYRGGNFFVDTRGGGGGGWAIVK